MRKLILLLVMISCTNFYSYGQKVYNLDAQKVKSKYSVYYKPTGDFAIHNGKQYIVYISQKGKYFIIVTSKSGKTYKKYFKTTTV